MARPELTQEELKKYTDEGKTMIWQYRTLYQVNYSQAQGLFYLQKVLQLPKDRLNISKAGRFDVMTPEHAQSYI